MFFKRLANIGLRLGTGYSLNMNDKNDATMQAFEKLQKLRISARSVTVCESEEGPARKHQNSCESDISYRSKKK